LDAGALAKPFYYRAYFNMGVIGSIFTALGLPPETIELLMGITGKEGKSLLSGSRRKCCCACAHPAFTLEKIRYSRKFRRSSRR